MRPVLVVDGANVVGSVPDGWWRDRAAAAARLRDALARVSEIPGVPGPPHLVLVVEGAARGLAGVDTVEVVSAPGSGDDTIVEIAAARAAEGPVWVVTADRALRDRVRSVGADVLGPTAVPRR